MPPTLRAVLFDMGNTLLEFETLPWKELDVRAVASAHRRLRDALPGDGIPTLEEFGRLYREAVEDLERQAGATLREFPLAEVFDAVLRRAGVPAGGTLLRALEEAHYEPIRAQVSLYPDAVPTLEALRAGGMRIGVVSNSFWPADLHVDDLRRLGLYRLLDLTLFSRDFGLRKPHAAIFREALRGVGARPEEAVFVGDRAESDIRGARAAGLRAVLRVHPRTYVRGHVPPDAEIHALRELPAVLESLFGGGRGGGAGRRPSAAANPG